MAQSVDPHSELSPESAVPPQSVRAFQHLPAGCFGFAFCSFTVLVHSHQPQQGVAQNKHSKTY